MDTIRERFTAITTQLLDEDPRLAVVLTDISADRFTDAARAHPDRVINVGIREQLLVSTGGGLALSGMRPIVHTFASFLVERPFEQVKLDFGHQGTGGVLVSAGGSYDWPAGGFTHMAPGDVALLDTLDGWTRSTCRAIRTRRRPCCDTRRPPVTTGSSCAFPSSPTRRRAPWTAAGCTPCARDDGASWWPSGRCWTTCWPPSTDWT